MPVAINHNYGGMVLPAVLRHTGVDWTQVAFGNDDRLAVIQALVTKC